ncbi:ribosome recycling factor [Candidatus Falkowbacteria bacterium RBG_13_39_14]|uniref:Ribosome-recycling factor n=1 Tax=Candidatus Falkowbacteria bacterium RBG_13_39_14 TaxID=1797985 RepID=A0A1F5S457_9BACT|nr:MAG: ribosome recycling factor [Candidatus Falkowbacteria bacterium RBG_13_39_14]
MSQIISEHNDEFNKVIEHFKTEISSLKTGRATPLLVENILVESYGAKMPLKQVASIGVPEPRCILIEPWDKSIIKEIEKSIINAGVGLNPKNEGQQLRISIQPLTEEDRKNLVKILNQKAEVARISIRGLRDKVKDNIQQMEKGKEITEDDRFRLQKELDEFTGDYNEKIKEVAEKKEGEINTI